MGESEIVTAPTWTWAVPLIVAVVALIGVMFASFIQWRNFKKQILSAHTIKVAEMRQQWINSLRDAMSEFQSYGVTPGLEQPDEREFYAAGTKIELMMNPNDPDYEALSDSIYGFLEADNINEKYAANPVFIEICQRILKREWEVVKKDLHIAGGG